MTSDFQNLTRGSKNQEAIVICKIMKTNIDPPSESAECMERQIGL